MAKKPAIKAYSELQQAYDYFNDVLFNKELPDLLITFQRGRNTFGYFAPERFTGDTVLSELAMNPDYFGARSLADTLSTLVHEMCHVWQHHTPAKKCRGGYHDRVWGNKMQDVGLMPSNTGQVGGKKTGQQMTHYIIRGGRFQTAVYELLKSGFSISWYDKWTSVAIVASKANNDILDDWLRVTDKNDSVLINKLTLTVSKSKPLLDDDDDELSGIDIKPPIKGTTGRDKFSCPNCGLNAWAKPTANLVCGDCDLTMVSEENNN
ncbi:zinc metalloprotease [Pectobacterium atrosepticum]|nr:SprT-like domain-containing protein [Pectobacterium atrosepticum]KFX10709.1 zinc metalloprotease [Pectobacterium atrosepticum]